MRAPLVSRNDKNNNNNNNNSNINYNNNNKFTEEEAIDECILINRECKSCIRLLAIVHFTRVTSGNESGVDQCLDTTLPTLEEERLAAY